MPRNKIIIGVLFVVVLVSIVLITLGDDVRIRVDNDKSTLYVKNDNNRWIVGGREYVSIFDGSSKLYRNRFNIKVETIIDKEADTIAIVRTTPYIRGPVVKDTWFFSGKISDVKLFPIYHTVEVFNASGFFLRYEVRDLEYNGGSYSLVGQTHFLFGRNIKVEINPGYRWGKVYTSGIVKAQYNIASDYESFHFRLFDPPGDVGYEYLDGGSILHMLSLIHI